MKALAVVDKYPPTHNAGADVMLHVMLRDLVRRGHEVTVAGDNVEPGVFDGVAVVKARAGELRRLAVDADVVISHLKAIGPAVAAAGPRPVVQILHRDKQPIHPGASLVVANSEWLAFEHRTFTGKLVVVRPPVWVAEYETDISAATDITLVNIIEAKGSGLFWQLAQMMPERQFLGVLGGYGSQVVHRAPNVEIVAHTPHVVSAVYARTRVLLVPSQHESWGRVAIEAACSGIPVLANPTVGLVEALGPAGLFIDRRRPNEWKSAIAALDDPDLYRVWSDRVRARAVELDGIARDDLDRFHRHLCTLVGA